VSQFAIARPTRADNLEGFSYLCARGITILVSSLTFFYFSMPIDTAKAMMISFEQPLIQKQNFCTFEM
jgi:hypothetical protein